MLAIGFELLVVHGRFVDEMAAQVAFADREFGAAARVRVRQLRHGDVGDDPAFLHRPPQRRIVARRGDLHRAGAAVVEEEQRLDRTLAKAALAHHDRAALILQGPGDDFRSRGRARVDQHDHRHALGQIARNHAFGAEVFVIPHIAAALRNDIALGQEDVRQGHCFFQRTAWILAQVKHQAVQLAAGLLLQVFQRLRDIGADVGAEFVDRDDADAFLHFPGHRLQLDHPARDGDVKRLVAARAENGQADVRTSLAPHLGHGIVQLAAIDQLAIKVRDIVARLDPGRFGRAALHRGDHLDRAVVHDD